MALIDKQVDLVAIVLHVTAWNCCSVSSGLAEEG